MTPAWEIVRTDALPGDDGQLLLLDREDGAGGRTVCIVPGRLEWRSAEGDVVRLLDEHDVANAKVIAAAPRMRAVLQRLTEWASSMGGWEAPCWAEAQTVLASLQMPDLPAEHGP